MIRATASVDGLPFTFNATVGGLAIYLDNWALIDLAEGNPSRRKRFVATLQSGADVLFSLTNVVELSGPQGESIDIVRNFLDEIGPHWFPVELVSSNMLTVQVESVGNTWVQNHPLSPGPSTLCGLAPDLDRVRFPRLASSTSV